MQRPTLLVFVTSLIVLLVRAEGGNLNYVRGRSERSPDIFVDSPEATATDQGHRLVALAVKNQDGDNTSSRLEGYSQQISEDGGDGTPPYRGNGELLVLSGDNLGVPAVGKRFSEFIGKRAGTGQDTPTAYLDDEGFNSELRSLQKVDQEQENSNQLAADMISNMGLVGGVVNELPSGQLSKREYEFVGKRNYDFVGKKSYDQMSAGGKFHFPGKRYDFLGKRSPYEFVGKKSYDFLGKRSPYEFVGKKSYDFLGKRSPYEFVGKRSYDFLGKRSPNEFVGKSNQDNQGGNSDHRVNPFLPTKDLQNTPFYSWQDLPEHSAQDVGDAGKRYSEFLGKKKRNEGHEYVSNADRLATLLQNSNIGTDKRYSEFLGKRKRSEEHEDLSLSNTERLAALLQNNGLRKRLSRMLLNRRLDDNYPGFIGK
uniref:Fulicin n=1 Tax=Deroceras reticulatum TaxID=145610 RepID=A0A1X9WED3_DERRE|nr:fulicin [Deroceras reticulatum]